MTVYADVATIQRWAAEWPTACGVLLHPDGAVNVWHEDPTDPSAVLDHLHQETLHGIEAEASARLRAEADRVVSLGFGFRASATGALVISLGRSSGQADETRESKDHG